MGVVGIILFIIKKNYFVCPAVEIRLIALIAMPVLDMFQLKEKIFLKTNIFFRCGTGQCYET